MVYRKSTLAKVEGNLLFVSAVSMACNTMLLMVYHRKWHAIWTYLQRDSNQRMETATAPIHRHILHALSLMDRYGHGTVGRTFTQCKPRNRNSILASLRTVENKYLQIGTRRNRSHL